MRWSVTRSCGAFNRTFHQEKEEKAYLRVVVGSNFVTAVDTGDEVVLDGSFFRHVSYDFLVHETGV